MNEMVERAKAFAVAAHGAQQYGDGPYSRHLEAVADIVAPWGETAQVVAWLHDVVEDTEIGVPQIRVSFGEDVARAVFFCTDWPARNRRQRKQMTNAKLAEVSPADYVALVVKVADRLANVRESAATGDSRLEMYRREHPEFRAAVYRPGLCDDLWADMGRIFATVQTK